MFTDNTPDTLSETLMKMKLKQSAAGAIDGAGSWALQLPAHEGFKLQLLLKGESWITVDGEKLTHHVREGDCVLMTSGKPAIVARSRQPKKLLRIESLQKTARNGVMTVNGGGEFFSVGVHFLFDGPLPKLLFAQLPPVIHIPGHQDQAAVLRWNIERFRAEYIGNSLGRSLILNHYAPIIFLQILRIYLASADRERNWLVALSDPKLSKVIEAMHSDYQRAWSLEELAAVAGMSRSGFALNFKKQVGISPIDYLTNWRMQIACELLKSEGHSISMVADAVGYESESAFSVAFKKNVKVRPGAYQRSAPT